jgi:hypothetical protein
MRDGLHYKKARLLIIFISINDIRQLDLNLLKVFNALLVERSVTRAAQRLSLTQPPVSGMPARLRVALVDARPANAALRIEAPENRILLHRTKTRI